jgi:DNA-binding NtrC family response regulator
MANIVIMDDNRSAGVLLKRALELEAHQVCLVANWHGLSVKIEDPPLDLVLIHQDHQEDFGWTAFNQFKHTHQDIPAMLYVMPDYSSTNMCWIVKAVQEALAKMNKLDEPTALWTWDTACNDSGISFFTH